MRTIEIFKDYSEKEKELASYRQVDSLGDLQRILSDLKKYDLIYRGLNNGAYKNYSSAQRHWLWKDGYYKNIGGKDFCDFIERTLIKARKDNKLIGILEKHNLSKNDFLILSVLQHYINISPLLDFTSSFETGVFFAIDNYSDSDPDMPLSEYVSLYYIDNRVDWMRSSIQSINQGGIPKAEAMVRNFENIYHYRPDASAVIDSTINLRFSEYKDLGFIAVDGPDMGITKIISSYLGFSCVYDMSNPRIEAQNGKFICNPSPNVPLVERLNDYTGFQRLVNCIDINKKLIPQIKSTILEPAGISSETIYPSGEMSKKLEILIKSRFEDKWYKRLKYRVRRIFVSI